MVSRHARQLERPVFASSTVKKPRSLVQANKTVNVPAVPSSVIRGRPTYKTERDISDAAHVALKPKSYVKQAFGDLDSKAIHETWAGARHDGGPSLAPALRRVYTRALATTAWGKGGN